MNSTILKITLARLLTLLLLLVSNILHAWPSVEEPPGATLESMGGDLKYNGLEMRSWVFHTPISSDRVLDFYRNRWSNDEIDETVVGPWQQISRKKDRYFITIQIQDGPARGTIGRINMMDQRDLKNSHKDLGKGIPALPGSRVINDIISNDERRNARTVSLTNNSTIENNANFYLNHYRATDWNISENTPFPEQGHLIVLKRSSDEITITISKASAGTTVLINQLTTRRWYH